VRQEEEKERTREQKGITKLLTKVSKLLNDVLNPLLACFCVKKKMKMPQNPSSSRLLIK
jgi:hypothetical protein